MKPSARSFLESFRGPIMSSHSSEIQFQTTCWTQVNDAAKRGENDNQALEALCRRYWYPLYAFLRRSGHDNNTAEDLVQGFFADLLERDSLKFADPNRGKFRSFLLTACKNFVSNQQRYQQAVRRGGRTKTISLDFSRGESRYLNEPVDSADPQKLFQRRWALETIESALAELHERYVAAGKEDRFLALQQLIAPASLPPSHAELANQLGMTEGAVKVAAHRLRQQFAAALRDQVAATIDLNSSHPENSKASHHDRIEAELQELLNSLQ